MKKLAGYRSNLVREKQDEMRMHVVRVRMMRAHFRVAE
jgi:hypothetical protein